MKPSYSGCINYGLQILIGGIGIRIPILGFGLFSPIVCIALGYWRLFDSPGQLPKFNMYRAGPRVQHVQART